MGQAALLVESSKRCVTADALAGGAVDALYGNDDFKVRFMDL